MNFFFRHCPSRNIISITGTKGKGTTATLITKIIKAASQKVFLGGNIGVAPINFLDHINPEDYVVLELSSFHLEDLRHQPRIAIITNIYPEHLSPADPTNPNYHKNFKSYLQAKLNIGRFQKKSGYLLLNAKFKKDLRTAENLPGKKIWFQASNTPSKLAGEYYKDNVGAAETAAKILNIPESISRKAINHFRNMPHRLELVRNHQDIAYYDNSFSTTPESSALDLESFENIILLAGGADKGADFKTFSQAIKNRVKFLALFSGPGTDRLLLDLQAVNFPQSRLKIFDSMPAAFAWVRQKAQPGDKVILSTGCASFGVFKNYKERGRLFQEEVQKL